MGFFGKIKNILFEEEEEFEDSMPVFTKTEDKVNEKKEEVKEEVSSKQEPPIKVTNGSRFRNVKRDIDISLDEKDVLEDINGGNSISSLQEEVKLPKKKEEDSKSVFQSFDVDEFERLNSRINKNENSKKTNTHSNVKSSYNDNVNRTRRTNNHFSSTVSSRDVSKRNLNLSSTGNSTSTIRKPFVPSPVISPVYGILDKNYKKSDIVDKKHVDNKSFSKNNFDNNTQIEDFDVNLDYVRRKAFGAIDNAIEKKKEETEIDDIDLFNEVTPIQDPIVDTVSEVESEIVIDDVGVDDSIDLEVSQEAKEQYEEEKDFNDLKVEPVEEKEDHSSRTAKVLEDMEKTSTLQILDDIEKELNSIKPISKNDEDDSQKEDDNDTLETDLFNLIDSMYEEGEEDHD